jgi:hypothetical protein
MKKLLKYYVRDTGNVKEQLTNGSFLRVTTYYKKPSFIARYSLGDFDICLGTMPEGYVEVPYETAHLLIPKCCK